MIWTSAEISALVGSYLWPLFRITALMSLAPIIGNRLIPVRIRMALAVALTVLVVPLLPYAPPIDPLSPSGVLVGVQQVLIGVAMAFALQLVFAAFVLGGQVTAMGMGLGFASMNDPVTGVVVPTVSQFFTIMITLAFLALNGHLAVIELLVDSFRAMPIAPDGLTADSLWRLVAWGGRMFSGAVLIALPAVAAMLVVNLGFGIMTRAAPQLNIFAVGFPIIITVGFVVLLMAMPSMLSQFVELNSEAFGMLRGILGIGG